MSTPNLRDLKWMGRRTGESPLEEPIGYGFSLPLAIVAFVVEGKPIGPDESSNIRAICEPVPQGPPANCSGLETVGDGGGVGVRRCICPGFLRQNLPTVRWVLSTRNAYYPIGRAVEGLCSARFWPSLRTEARVHRSELLWKLCCPISVRVLPAVKFSPWYLVIHAEREQGVTPDSPQRCVRQVLDQHGLAE